MLGIGAVDGVAIESAYLFEDCTPVFEKTRVQDTDRELRRLHEALATAADQIQGMIDKTRRTGGDDNAEIFNYQLLILKDTDFTGAIESEIETAKISCEYAVAVVCDRYRQLFWEMDNDYLRQRAGDIEDIKKRLHCALSGIAFKTLAHLSAEVILAANDLTPSQTADLNPRYVKGILLEKGGKSSHTVILARSMGIPCIVGLDGLMRTLMHGEKIIIDGTAGEVIIKPTDAQTAYFSRLKQEAERKNKQLEQYRRCKGMTLDGYEVKIFANITSVGETAELIKNGGEGVGLLRTEFIYMASDHPPAEDTQYAIYAEIAELLEGRPCIIRSLDAGGDKRIAYLGIGEEENPFLGYRAIRYCIDHTDIFKTQIAAVLRAAVCGNIYLMFPMVATIEEFRRAKALVRETGEELRAKGIPHGRVRVGLMIETPSAVFLSDQFAGEAEFFSIGTNDLTQYLFAADRNNQKVAHLNSSFQPALLNAVYRICEAANRHGIEVDICGQAGEIPELTPLWVAMGVTNLSVSIPAIPLVRKIICETNKKRIQEDLPHILKLGTAQEVSDYLRKIRDTA